MRDQQTIEERGITQSSTVSLQPEDTTTQITSNLQEATFDVFLHIFYLYFS